MAREPIENTIEVKFRGVPFFIQTETQEGGRKVAVHEYPGSDKRFVEDLGRMPGIFRLNGFVSGPNWVQQANKLTTALEQSATEGMLELSVFGIRKVKPQTFTKTVRQTAIGIIDFNITFLVSVPNPSPAIAVSSVQTTATAAINVLDKVQTNVAGTLVVPTENTTALVSTYDGSQLVGIVADAVSKIGQDVDPTTGLSTSIQGNINELVRDPDIYSAALFNDGLLGTVFDTVLPSTEALAVMAELVRIGYNLAIDFESIEGGELTNIDIGFAIPIFGTEVQYRVTNNSNRLAIIVGFRTSIFAIYLNQAARHEYFTDDEITETIANIEDAYQSITLDNDVDPIVALALDLCRIEALNVLEDKIQTTPNVVDYRLKTRTVDVELAYRLYAEEFGGANALVKKAEILTDLNGILPNRYDGTVKVLRL